PAQKPPIGRIEPFRAGAAEPDDRSTFHVEAVEIFVARARRIEAVSGKLDAIDRSAPLRADVPGKDDAGAVSKRARFAADLNRERRMTRAFHSEDADRLQVGSVVARRVHAPRVKMRLDVRGGQAHPGAEYR